MLRLSFVALGAAPTEPPQSTLLSRTPMIMAHDAGSGYLPGDGLIGRWTRTQSGGFDAQLECGARAFDARPLYRRGRLIWHHGTVAVEFLFAQAVEQAVEWLGAHPSELAVLNIWDCEGDGCIDACTTALARANITTVSDCARLGRLTYGEARALGALPGGGSLVAFTGAGGTDAAACAVTDYDPSLTCVSSGSGKAGVTQVDAVPNAKTSTARGARLRHGCWRSDAGHAAAMERMVRSLDAFIGSAESDMFAQAQALWQESAASVAVGASRNSSLLRDERESGLNAALASLVRAGRWRGRLNLLELNNVCDGGPQLLAAMRGDGGRPQTATRGHTQADTRQT